MKRTTTTCPSGDPHRWLIADASTASGGLIVGVCRGCGIERAFATAIPDIYAPYKTPKLSARERKVLDVFASAQQTAEAVKA